MRTQSFCLGVVVSLLAPQLAHAQAGPGQGYYRNPVFGFELAYPPDRLQPAEAAQSGEGQSFLSPDGAARVIVYGAANQDGFTPQSYRQALIEENPGYDALDYQPRGRTWFVLSGRRNDRIFYEKIMFTCGGRVINVLAISFPAARKSEFEPLVEKLEDDFRPAFGDGCRAAQG